MSKAELARILNAFISRIPLGDLDRIAAQERACWKAWANGSTSWQVKQQDHLSGLCFDAIEHLADHDREMLNKIITGAIDNE